MDSTLFVPIFQKLLQLRFRTCATVRRRCKLESKFPWIALWSKEARSFRNWRRRSWRLSFGWFKTAFLLRRFKALPGQTCWNPLVLQSGLLALWRSICILCISLQFEEANRLFEKLEPTVLLLAIGLIWKSKSTWHYSKSWSIKSCCWLLDLFGKAKALGGFLSFI